MFQFLCVVTKAIKMARRSKKVLVSLCCYTKLLCLSENSLSFQFLCVVTFTAFTMSFPAFSFQFLCVVTIFTYSPSVNIIMFQFLCVVIGTCLLFLLVICYLHIRFSFFVLLLDSYLSPIYFYTVLVSLCCYIICCNIQLWRQGVLVSLCCYNFLVVRKQTVWLLFQFLCVVTQHRLGLEVLAKVLVSLCCYL